MPDENNKPQGSGFLKAMAVTSMIGTEMAITVTAGYFIGKRLDNAFDTEPWIMIASLLLGVAAGIWGIINIVKRFL